MKKNDIIIYINENYNISKTILKRKSIDELFKILTILEEKGIINDGYEIDNIPEKKYDKIDRKFKSDLIVLVDLINKYIKINI